MGSLITTKFVAVGAHAGATLTLGRDPAFNLVNGELELVATPEETGKLAHFLEVMWQIFPEGSKALRKAQAIYGQRDLSSGGVQPDGAGDLSSGDQPDGAGAAGGLPESEGGEGATGSDAGDEGGETGPLDGPEPELNQKLQRAVLSLDPEVDEAWTAGGLPAIAAVSQAYGSEGITRADIAAVAPGYTRAQARKAGA